MSEALAPEATRSQHGKGIPPGFQATVWRPGQSGNPLGRPKGSRNLLTEDFLGKLKADFAAHGEEAISDLREADPGKYLTIIASLVPKDMHLEVSGPALAGMSDETLGKLLRVMELLAQAGGQVPVEKVIEAVAQGEAG